jgi:hypothetical protein
MFFSPYTGLIFLRCWQRITTLYGVGVLYKLLCYYATLEAGHLFLFSAYKFNRDLRSSWDHQLTFCLSDPNLGATPFSFVCTGVKYHENFFVLRQNRDRLTQDAGRTKKKKIRSIVFRRQRFLSRSADCSGKKINDIIPTV